MEILEDKVLLWLGSAQFVKAKPGVYVLYDKNKDVIYIGESENLQNQFTKYVDSNFENDTCKQKTQTYQLTSLQRGSFPFLFLKSSKSCFLRSF